MKGIAFANQQFILDSSGVLIWPEKAIAVVADMHLEKASYFAMHGQMLPPHDSLATLEKLRNTLDRFALNQLILLGDSLHDEQGYYRLGSQSKAIFDQLCQDYHITWIVGNHDGCFIPPNVTGVAEMEFAGIVFRHQAEHQPGYEISGHYHPKAWIKIQQTRLSRACFMQDRQKIILPAFGALTGGLDVKEPVLQALFAKDCVLHLLGNGKVYSIPADRVC